MPYKIFSDCFRILSRTYFEILPRISLRSVMDCSRDSLMNFCWFLLYSFRTPPEIASRKPSRNFFWASFWDSSRKLLSDSFKNSSGNLWEYFFRDSSYNWSRFYFPEIRSLPWGAGANTGWRSLNRTRFHNLGLYFQQMMSANFPLPLRFPPHYGHHRQIGIPSGTMTSCHPGRNGTRCWWRRKRTRGSTRILRLLRWWELRGLSKLPRVIFIAVVVVDLSLRKTPIRRHKTTSASLPQTQRYAQFFFLLSFREPGFAGRNFFPSGRIWSRKAEKWVQKPHRDLRQDEASKQKIISSPDTSSQREPIAFGKQKGECRWFSLPWMRFFRVRLGRLVKWTVRPLFNPFRWCVA